MEMTSEPKKTINKRTKVKKLLRQAYAIAKENPKDFPDQNIPIHIGSIMNKWFGGVNDEPVSLNRKTAKKLAPRIFKPKENDFKKKSVEAVIVAPVDLEKMTLPELKQIAKGMGIKFTGRSMDELVKDITWHRKGVPVPSDEDEEFMDEGEEEVEIDEEEEEEIEDEEIEGEEE